MAYYDDHGNKYYTHTGVRAPGAYLDSTKTLILFVALKLDFMETSSSSDLRNTTEETRAKSLAFVKYPNDSSLNSILSNSFQFTHKRQIEQMPLADSTTASGLLPYNYTLQYPNSNGYRAKVSFSVGNWFFDFKSGIITFADDPGTSTYKIDNGQSDLDRDYLYFTFVKYVGPRGLDKLIDVTDNFDSTATSGFYENQIVVDSSNSEIYLMKDGSWNSIGGGGGGGGGAFTIDGNNAYYNSGNVGIGTSSPSSTLDVSGSANITGDLTIGTSSINVKDQLDVLDASINML
jgi:hypothetical protein